MRSHGLWSETWCRSFDEKMPSAFGSGFHSKRSKLATLNPSAGWDLVRYILHLWMKQKRTKVFCIKNTRIFIGKKLRTLLYMYSAISQINHLTVYEVQIRFYCVSTALFVNIFYTIFHKLRPNYNIIANTCSIAYINCIWRTLFSELYTILICPPGCSDYMLLTYLQTHTSVHNTHVHSSI